MVFVHEDDRTLAAGFQQNALQRVRPGDEAEVVSMPFQDAYSGAK